MNDIDPQIKSQILALKPESTEVLSPQQQQTLGSQLEILLEEVVQAVDITRHDSVSYGPGRPRILPSAMLWIGVVICALRGYQSQLSLHRLLRVNGFWTYHPVDICDETVYKRLEAEGVAPFVKLFEMISTVMRSRLSKLEQPKFLPWAGDIVALDQTTLDQVARTLPALRKVAPGSKNLIAGKLSALFDIRLQIWRSVEYIAEPDQNEKKSARETIKNLAKGTLILADLGYFAFKWFDELNDDGYFWISRLREKTSYFARHTFYSDETVFDGIVWLGNYRADKAANAIRLIQFTFAGKQYQYITNVISPFKLSMSDIVVLYSRRWDIELAFKMIKRFLKLHIFWSAKQVVILQQVWSALCAAQILLALRTEIALVAGVDVYDVSMQLLVENLPQQSAAGTDIVAWFVKYGDVGFIRPNTRKKWEAPQIPLEKIVPLPEDLVMKRIPRYAERSSPEETARAKEVDRKKAQAKKLEKEKAKADKLALKDICVGALPKTSKAYREEQICFA